MDALFEPIAADPSCDFCTGQRPAARLDVDAVYCISLREQPQRAARAAAHFHAIGLCRQVTFYRPARARNSTRGVWESHRAVAQEALARGYRRVLVLEDDVDFRRPIAELAPRVSRALAALTPDWWCLYLGHLPFGGYFVASGLVRVRATCAHAYIANAPLLEWLATTKPMIAEVPIWKLIGMSIDSAMSCLPGMYAVYPMMATQKFLGDYRLHSRMTPDGRRRKWNDSSRWRNLFIFRGPLIAERVVAVFSRLHALTLERNIQHARMGSAEDAKAIRAAGLFDDEFYLRKYPDVVAADLDPLMHYLWHGAAEGRWPNPSFDPTFYAKQARLKRGKNPLLHYLKVGRQRGFATQPAQS